MQTHHHITTRSTLYRRSDGVSELLEFHAAGAMEPPYVLGHEIIENETILQRAERTNAANRK